MDFVEQTIGRFRKKDPQTQTPTPPSERKPTNRFWTYDHFREYLLALGRGKDFMLPQNQYPDLIELNQEWNSTIEEARQKTKSTRHEHYFSAGTKTRERIAYLPTQISVGNQGSVPSKIISESRSKSTKFGIDSIPGDVHSHPSSPHAEFSMSDLYTLIHPGSKLAFIGVVAGNENLFAFKARESTPAGEGNVFLDQSNFARIWYEQNGWKFDGYDSKGGGEMAHRVKKDAPSPWQLNLNVAKRHNLVLYSADAKTELVKVFPTAKI